MRVPEVVGRALEEYRNWVNSGLILPSSVEERDWYEDELVQIAHALEWFEDLPDILAPSQEQEDFVRVVRQYEGRIMAKAEIHVMRSMVNGTYDCDDWSYYELPDGTIVDLNIWDDEGTHKVVAYPVRVDASGFDQTDVTCGVRVGSFVLPDADTFIHVDDSGEGV